MMTLLLNVLTQLKGFKFVTTLDLMFEKTESKDKTKYDIFVQAQKQKWLSMKVTLIMCFNQFILQAHQIYKIH